MLWCVVFVLCSCRDPGDLCPSFRSVWLPYSRSKFLAERWAAMGFQSHRNTSWVPAQIWAERVLADAITIDGHKEWICKFCSEANVWTRWRCRRCYSNIPAGLQEKHKHAIFAKNKGWYSGSSSSNGGKEKRLRDQEEEEELRAQVELLRKQQRVEKGPETQGEPTRRGSGLEEYCKMEVEEEIDCKKTLDEQRKSLQKQLRDIEKFTDMEPMFWDSHKEKWKGQLQVIARMRTKLLPEHQKMQKRSQKLQSLQDKKRHFLKEACACEEEMRKVSEEFRRKERMAADNLEDEIKILQAGEERRVSCAWQFNGCFFDPAMVDQIFACGAVHAEPDIQATQEEFIRRFKPPAAPEQMAGGAERREWEEWEENAKGVQVWVLLGTRMQMVKLAEEESQHAKKLTVCSRKFPFPARRRSKMEEDENR